MSHFVTQKLLKVTRGISIVQRGFKFYMAGIIPGGGLGKLQGIKEEEYFSRMNHKLFESLKEKSENPHSENVEVFNGNPIFRAFDCIYSVRHKNCLEEAYFLNEHCDCLQLLKQKAKPIEKKPDAPCIPSFK